MSVALLGVSLCFVYPSYMFRISLLLLVVIFALLGIVQASLTLLSLIAKIRISFVYLL